jgi:hypothetical protein
MPLEDHYSGDMVFEGFIEALQGHVGTAFRQWCGHQSLVEACGGDAGLALAVFYVGGEGSLKWMDEQVPVLGGTTPRKCVETSTGRDRLKEALLRFP